MICARTLGFLAALWVSTAAWAGDLVPGPYEVVATLDLRGAQSGDFQGVVSSAPVELDIGSGSVPGGSVGTAALADLADRMEHTQVALKRRELALAMESPMLEAPLLAPGPPLDALARLHLAELTRQMCTREDVYTASAYAGMGPRNDLLFAKRVLTSPGRLSPDFAAHLRGTPLGPHTPKDRRGRPVDVEVSVATDVEAFWKSVQDDKQPALHVFPVHLKEGIARVATSLVLPQSGPERFAHISYWKRSNAGWRLLSFEPLPPRFEPRLWHSNIHHNGPAPGKPSELTEAERAQWLEIRLDLVGLNARTRAEAGRGGAVLGGLFGADVIDATYVGLLEKHLSTPNPDERAAILTSWAAFGGTPSVEQLIEVIPDVHTDQGRQGVVDCLWRSLQPRFRSEGRPPTPEEATALNVAAGSRGGLKVTILEALHLAHVEVNEGSSGWTALYRQDGATWKQVTGLGGWIQ